MYVLTHSTIYSSMIATMFVLLFRSTAIFFLQSRLTTNATDALLPRGTFSSNKTKKIVPRLLCPCPTMVDDSITYTVHTMAATSNANTATTGAASSHEDEDDESGLADWIALSEQIATALDPKVGSTTRIA